MRIGLDATKLLLCIHCVLTAIGCSGEVSGPTLYPVKGTVKKAGTGLKEVSISLVPVDEKIGITVVGATNEQGQFEITTPQGKKGAPAGTYKVVLAVDMKVDYSKTTGPRSTPATAFPKEYSSAATSPKAFDVKASGENTLDLDL